MPQDTTNFEFMELAFEIAFGDDAINKGYSREEVLDRLQQFSDRSNEMEEKLNYGYGNDKTNSIAIVWCIDDVRSALRDLDLPKDFLNNEECMQVLYSVEDDVTLDFFDEHICDALEEEFEEKISDYRNKQKESEGE